MMYSWRRPSPARLDRFVRDQSARQLTYGEVGATAGIMPAGYRHDRWRTDLGRYDEARFHAAAAGLFRWKIQEGAGLKIIPAVPVRPGATFAILMGMPAGFLVAAGRIVFVVDEPGRRGFGYGTLPAHPEQGEESFLVAREDDRLVFHVTAFSRPRHPLVRCAAPLARVLQVRMNRRYAAVMCRILA
jgi:uncharacterized protein (UPF0548 family)